MRQKGNKNARCSETTLVVEKKRFIGKCRWKHLNTDVNKFNSNEEGRRQKLDLLPYLTSSLSTLYGKARGIPQ